jgi:putative acetyltransferase
MTTVKLCRGEEDFKQAKSLILDYAEFLGMDLSFQDFDSELGKLDAMYNEPAGAFYLLSEGTKVVGGGGIRRFEPGIGEIKRMYIYPAFRGKKLGRLLLDTLIGSAKALGFTTVRLDTVRWLPEALSLYQRYGFYQIGSYRFNPDPEAVYMEYKL